MGRKSRDRAALQEEEVGARPGHLDVDRPARLALEGGGQARRGARLRRRRRRGGSRRRPGTGTSRVPPPGTATVIARLSATA